MWQLDRTTTEPLYQQIIQLVLTNIQTGKLLPGDLLPPERKLAELLEVNRSTVVRALDELTSKGVLIRKQGSGTRVNPEKWGRYTGFTANWKEYLTQGAFNQEEPYLTKIKQVPKSETVDNLATGDLPLSLIPSIDLPNITWKEFIQEEEQEDILGYLPLREKVAAFLAEENQLTLPASQLLLTSGAQQALFLLIQVLLAPGDAVAIEQPSFFYALPIFQAAGIRVYGVPVSETGMDLDQLEDLIVRKKIKMMFTNPNFQNPTGYLLGLSYRKKLLNVCRSYQIPVVEDDVFGQLYIEKKDRPTQLKQLDFDNVIYIGSLSKILGSTTKIGWISAPVQVLEQLTKARQAMDFSMSIFPQVLAYDALKGLMKHGQLEDLRAQLVKKQQQFIQQLEKECPNAFTYFIPKGGYYLWLTYPHKRLTKKDYDLFIHQELLVMPSFLFGADSQSFRVNYANLEDQHLPRIMAKLKKILKIWEDK